MSKLTYVIGYIARVAFFGVMVFGFLRMTFTGKPLPGLLEPHLTRLAAVLLVMTVLGWWLSDPFNKADIVLMLCLGLAMFVARVLSRRADAAHEIMKG